jgi:hypothetical protein
MKASDAKRFAGILYATFEVYGQQPSKMAVDIWWNALSEYTIEQVEGALAAHIRDADSGQFKPKPADVIRKIDGSREDKAAMAARAWARVMDHMNTTDSAIFDDPAIHYAIQTTFGTWVKAGLMTEKEAPFKQRDFIQAYTAYKPGLPYPPRLIGRTENSAAGGEVFFFTNHIGNADKCRAVEEQGRKQSALQAAKPALDGHYEAHG